MSVNIHRSRVSSPLWCHICSAFLISPANEVSPLSLIASSSLKIQQEYWIELQSKGINTDKTIFTLLQTVQNPNHWIPTSDLI